MKANGLASPKDGCSSGKISFAIRSSAKQFARKISKAHGVTMKVYKCECGRWHLFTMKGKQRMTQVGGFSDGWNGFWGLLDLVFLG
jgi:hypothetical protein